MLYFNANILIYHYSSFIILQFFLRTLVESNGCCSPLTHAPSSPFDSSSFSPNSPSDAVTGGSATAATTATATTDDAYGFAAAASHHAATATATTASQHTNGE